MTVINAKQYSGERKSMVYVGCVISAISCVCVVSAMDDGNCSPE